MPTFFTFRTSALLFLFYFFVLRNADSFSTDTRQYSRKDCTRQTPLQPVRVPGSKSDSIIQVANQHTEATTDNPLSRRIAFRKMMAKYEVAAVLSRQPPTCTLLGMPREIRASTLEYLLISDYPLVPSLLPCDLTIPPTKKRCDYQISSRHTLHLNILRTCKQLDLEGDRFLTKENSVHSEMFLEHIAALGYRIPFDMPLNPAHRAFADLRRFRKFELVYVKPFLERRHQRLRRALQKEKLDAILEGANFGVCYRYGLVSGAYDTRPFSDPSGFWHVLKVWSIRFELSLPVLEDVRAGGV